MDWLFGLPAYRMGAVHVGIILILAAGWAIYRYIYPKKTVSLLLVIIAVSVVPVLSSFRKGDYNGGLYQNAAFTASFYASLKEGNLVPRWAEKMDTHFGYPAFIFVYPLPLYLAAGWHLLGFNLVNSVKLVFTEAYILSGISMYLWARNRWVKNVAGLAAIVYLFAPYRFIVLYYRLDMGEAVAFIFMPLVFLCLEKKRTGWGAICTGLLILSHPALAVATVGLAVIYGVFIKNLKPVVWGILLTTYYWLPVLYESKFTQMKAYTNGEIISGVAFVKLKELLWSPYKGGLLWQGPNGESTYVIGYAVWLGAGWVIWRLLKKRAAKREKKQIVFWLAVWLLIIFMMLPESRPIWFVIPFIKNFQFSWRLLGIETLASAMVLGWGLTTLGRSKTRNRAAAGLAGIMIFTSVLNWGNRESSPAVTSDEQIAEMLPTEARKMHTGFPQALPIWVDLKNQWGEENVTEPIEVLNGEAKTTQIYRSSTRHVYTIETSEETVFKENTYYYPGWQLRLNGSQQPINYTDRRNPDVMEFSVKKGKYTAEFDFKNTPDRVAGWLISCIAGGMLLYTLTKRTRGDILFGYGR